LPDIQWEDGDSLWRPPSPGGTPPPLPTQQMPQAPPTETVPVVPMWARPPATAETVSLIGRDEAPLQVPPSPGEPTPVNASVDQRWRAVAGNGAGTAWLVWLTGLLWSSWTQSDPAFFGDGSSGSLSNAEHLSRFLLNIGNNIFGFFSLVGMVVLAAYALSSNRPHRIASWIAGGYLIIGLISSAAGGWAFVQNLHDNDESNGFAVGGVPTQLVCLGELIGALTVVALAVMVLRHRPDSASSFAGVADIELH
jgi:hypothetical protein